MKSWYNPNFLAIAALLILSFPALKNLAFNGFYTSHDGENHTARIAQYYNALKDGQIPPRFAGSFYNGLGSPIFVYIYPLPYLLGSAIHFAGVSYANSLKTLMTLSFIFSGIFSYLWFKEIFKSERAAFLGALFYMWVPYRFSLIYVRASLSEALAYTFVPLAFYTLTKLSLQKNLRWTAISALSYSLILLSQNLVALIISPVLLIYSLLISNIKSPKTFTLPLISFGWGLLIAAITYLPSIFERKFVRFDETISNNFVSHFATLKQLIYSPWGYGFDLPGTVNDQMSLQIGLAHLLVFVLAIFSVILFLRSKTKNWRLFFLLLFFVLVFLKSIFLTTQSQTAVLIWQKFKLAQIIDIPWRLLGLISISTAFFAAFTQKIIKPGLLLLALIFLVLFLNRNHLKINLPLDRDDDFFDNYGGTATQYNEFTPKWRQTTRVPEGFDPKNKVEIVSGSGEAGNLSSSSKKISFQISTKSDLSKVIVNKFYFPGVEVKVDGARQKAFNTYVVTDTQSLAIDKDVDKSGLIMLNLSQGKHKVEVNFKETPLRNIANILSGLSLIAALGFIVKNEKR